MKVESRREDKRNRRVFVEEGCHKRERERWRYAGLLIEEMRGLLIVMLFL